MKVLHLNTFADTGGAARAAERLHNGLMVAGIDSKRLVRFGGTKEDPSVQTFGTSFVRGTVADFRRHIEALPARFYPERPITRFSSAIVPDRLHREVAALAPDIVHLHWLGAGYCRLESLARLGRPLIWTLHDSWAFTGGCHIPFDCAKYRDRCGACPVLGSRQEEDLSRKVWERKNAAWRDLDLTVITPSRWLAGCARSSSLFGDRRIEIIPNGLDLNRLPPLPGREARRSLGLPEESSLILFGAAASTGDRNKGLHLLRAALRSLAEGGRAGHLELLVCGERGAECSSDFGVKVHHLGYINGDDKLNRLYRAADLFVAPSIQENLPNMVMEALACGTPCAAFDIGGMPELIEHRATGYIARPFDTDDLAAGIEWILARNETCRRKLADQARKRVEREYALAHIAHRHAELYRDILARQGTRESQRS